MIGRVSVIGLGRVGLPTAVACASAGAAVVGVERDPQVRRAILDGEVGPEPGLAEGLRRALAAGLEVRDRPVPAEVTAVCVPTPLGPDCRADLTDLWDAVAAVDAVAPADGLVVIASTVPVGTTEAVAARLGGRAVACCPERVWPGDALRELVENPRIVGGVTPQATERAAAWLAGFVRGPIDRTDARTAELAKLTENAARDVQIALANTVAATAEALGVDPVRLRALVNRHPRVALLEPGIGVGGHCLPVDPWFAIAAAPEHTALLRVAREVNDARPAHWATRIAEAADAAGTRRIGLLGLTYKADTDDTRGAPAAGIARALSACYDVLAADPFVTRLDGVAIGAEAAVRERDVVVLLVAHRGYVARGAPLGRVVVDACGGWR